MWPPRLCRFAALARKAFHSLFSLIMASKYVRKIDFNNIVASPEQQEFLLTEYRKDKNTNLGGRRGPYPHGRFWVWCNQKLEEAKKGHIEPRTAPTTGRAKPKAAAKGVKRKAAVLEDAASAETETETEEAGAEKEQSSPVQPAPSMLIMQDFQKAMQQAHAVKAAKANPVQASPAAEMVAINTKCITDEQLQLQRQEMLLNQPDTPAGLFMGGALAVQLGLCKTPTEYMVS